MALLNKLQELLHLQKSNINKRLENHDGNLVFFICSLDNATFTTVLKQWGTLQPTDEYDYWIGLILPSSNAPNDCWNQVTGDFILKTSMSKPDDRASVHWYSSAVVSGCYLFIARTSTALVIPNKSWSQSGQSGNIGVLVYGVKM